MDNDKTSDRRVVVILGMDRTGTSLCANILNALGMRLSPVLLPGTEFNPNGFFEDEEILLAHEWTLARLERSWDTLSAIHPFPPLWWQSPAMDPFRDTLVDIVRRRIDEGPGTWGFKDPRTAMLLPLWNEVFRICGVSPVFVLCVRHPAAVAHSLAARDRFSSLFSELLWFEKTLTGCLAIQDAPHCLIHYEEWFKDPLPQARILCEIAGLAPAGRPAALKPRLSSIVDSELRHQDGGAIISTAARDLYAQLVQSAKVPDTGVLRNFEFGCEVGRDFITTAERLTGERYSGQSASKENPSELAEDRWRWIHRSRALERWLGERDARLGEMEEDRARWMERCSAAEQTRVEVEDDRTRCMERCSAAEQALVERDACLREMEEDRARWMERCSAAENALVERDARLREVEEDWARQALVERDTRLREREEDRARWTERCSVIEQEGHKWKEQFFRAANLLRDRDREIAAIRASATWRWSRNALSSWPARHLLGPFIRAVAGRRG
jgi:hypothetical protein